MKGSGLIIRADASAMIGTGHIMRCLALAEAWRDSGGEAIFAVAETPLAIEQRLADENFSIVRIPKPAGGSQDADATVDLARECEAAWLVVDGDRFDVAFLQRVKSGARSVLLIDDFAERESLPSDLILNPNLDSTEGSYRKRGTLAPLLLGAPYVMLRREFTAWRGQRNFPEEARKILITLGGSDPDNLTPKVVEALGGLPSREITVIAGPGYPYLRELKRLGKANIRVVFSATNMRERMEHADLAVIAGGGTLWELLFMGCVVLSYARNSVQANAIRMLERLNVVADMGNAADFNGPMLAAKVIGLNSPSLRKRMAKRGRQLIDGKGAWRVVEAMKGLGVRR